MTDGRDRAGTPRVNEATGLNEDWDDFYRVPRVHQKGIGALRFNGQLVAVHRVPLGNRLTLDFYAELRRADELVVTFPGAARRDKNIYPFFARISTFRQREPAFMAFADPTILMDPARQMLLSWFLGGPQFDPAAYILRAIQRAQGKTGARHVLFVGGSGGGLAALRLSAMMPGSMAYVHEGATNVANSIPASVSQYFETVWPGWDQEKLLHAFPERFDMARHYQAHRPNNFVYFAQSEDDYWFRNGHYTPFKHAHGVTGDSGASRAGNRHFVLYKGEIAGHGKVAAAEFDNHFTTGRGLWRNWRSGRS